MDALLAGLSIADRPRFNQISVSDLQLDKKIGSGGFGQVLKATWNKTDVAVKAFKIDGGITPRPSAILQEIEIWSKLLHPHILQFLGANVSCDIPFIVMPYLRNGNSRDYITKNPACPRNNILHQVTLGLVYLHTNNVIHGDLKGLNVLIDDSGKAILCDFGIARVRDDALSTSMGSPGIIAGTRSYMPPEQLKGGSLRKPCDVYAFGMLIYEIHANANPLNLHVDYTEFVKMISVEGLRPEKPPQDEAPQLTEEIWRLAQQCWTGEAAKRPLIDKVCDSVARSLGNTGKSTSTTTSASTSASHFSELPYFPPPPYAKGPNIRAGRVINGPDKTPVACVAVSRDGKTIVSCQSTDVLLWDMQSGALRRKLSGHTRGVHCLAFFRNGKGFVSGGLDGIRVWDMDGREILYINTGCPVLGMSISPDDERIAAAGWIEPSICLYDAKTGRRLSPLTDSTLGSMSTVAYSPRTHDQHIACSANKAIAIWKRGRIIYRLKILSHLGKSDNDTGGGVNVAYSPTGSQIAAAQWSKITIFGIDDEDNQVVLDTSKETETPENPLRRPVAFSPDGKWVVARIGNMAIMIWDAKTGELLSGPYVGHMGPIMAISVTADGKQIVTGARDGTIVVWDL